MTSCAWLWIYAGSFLMLLELIVPGFVLCFVGLAAATVGVIRFFFGDSFGASWQLGIFSLATIFYIVVIRRALNGIFVGDRVESKTDFNHEFIGRMARVTEAIEPPNAGRVLLGDAEWTAVSAVPISAETNVMIVAQDNLTMKVEPLEITTGDKK